MKPNSENSWTSDALQRGDIDAIKERALSDPTYLDQRDLYGNTPLMTAVSADSIQLVEFLLQQNANPNDDVDDGYTCLLTAIESDNDESIAIVQLLLAAGADVHTIGINGWTPLHMAASHGHVEKCRLLIDAGADVNRRKEIDATETPLMEAAFSGQAETIRLLLEFGADPSMRDTINNHTAIEIAKAAANGPDPEVVKYLKEENIQVDVDEMFMDMDLPKDQLEQMKSMVGSIDMTQNYIDNSTALAETGEHATAIDILESHSSRRQIRFLTRALLIVAAVVTCLLVSLFTFSQWFDPFDDVGFDSEQWATASDEGRAPMARDVVSRVRGLNQQEVLDLLGEPGNRLNSGTDAGGHRLRGTEVFSYYIGSWSIHGMDDAFIYIHFDADGVAIHSEITGY